MPRNTGVAGWEDEDDGAAVVKFWADVVSAGEFADEESSAEDDVVAELVPVASADEVPVGGKDGSGSVVATGWSGFAKPHAAGPSSSTAPVAGATTPRTARDCTILSHTDVGIIAADGFRSFSCVIHTTMPY